MQFVPLLRLLGEDGKHWARAEYDLLRAQGSAVGNKILTAFVVGITASVLLLVGVRLIAQAVVEALLPSVGAPWIAYAIVAAGFLVLAAVLFILSKSMISHLSVDTGIFSRMKRVFE